MKTEYGVCSQCNVLIFRSKAVGRGWCHISYKRDIDHRPVPVEVRHGK
jgi:hypothetical protein